MSSQPRVATATFDEIRGQLVQNLHRLIHRPAVNGSGADDNLLDALAMLNALPLSTSEFGLAVSRLKNARRYYVAEETGAARFELQLLLASLNHSERDRPAAKAVSPTRPPG
jgi:hypothetical protein